MAGGDDFNPRLRESVEQSQERLSGDREGPTDARSCDGVGDEPTDGST
jgi:hypothetical protein